MIEKHIVLEDVDPVVFYGVNNTNPCGRRIYESRQQHGFRPDGHFQQNVNLKTIST